MKLGRLTTAMVAAGLVAAAAPVGVGQQGGGGGAIASAGTGGSEVGIEFRGGTLGDYFAALQEAAGVRKIVAMGELSDIEMPAVALSAVPLGDAVRAAEMHPSGRVNVSQRGDVWVVSVREAEPSREETAVWSVQRLLTEGVGGEDLLSAIEAAAAMSESGVDLRYHEATGLLIGRGAIGALQVVDHTIERLEESVEVRVEAEERAAEEAEEDLEAELEELRSLVEELEEENRGLRERSEVLAIRLNESEERRAREVERLEREVEAERMRAGDLAAQVETLRQQVMQLRAALERPRPGGN